MFRFAVLWYLVLAMAAGPTAFCCCKTEGLLASVRTAFTPTLAQTVSAPALPSCCHADPKPSPATSEQPAQLPGHAPDPRCPCPRSEGKPALPTGEQDFALTLALSVMTLPPALDGISTFVFTLEPPQTHLRGDDPGALFLSAQDLLRTHHQLRC
ncbi:MAG TPA: hypothetical protein VFG68_23250 [Fimbriiglobus sp.]|nr:hypothetical protein [Fimbriiglobus sp.]